MGALFTKRVHRKFGKRKPVPKDIAVEAKIAERVLSDLRSVESLGEQVPFNCPGCGGVLWKIGNHKSLRYRCHTGHAYTAPVLLAEQTAKIRSEEHTSELQSLMRISYAVFCLKNKTKKTTRKVTTLS